MVVFFREILGIQFALRKGRGILEMLLKVSWMVCVRQAVSRWSFRSQWDKSSSVFANNFFRWTLHLPALELQGLKNRQGQDRGQYWHLPTPAVKDSLGKLATGFVCADGCCALLFVNCIKFSPLPPWHCCWHSLLCVEMCQSNSSEAQLVHCSVRLPALHQWQPS